MTDSSLDPDKQLSFAEFSSLREEIYKRSEFMHQRESLAVTIWGAILALGLTAGSGNPSGTHTEAILIYPWIAYFIAAGWRFNLSRIRQIGRFLKELERNLAPNNASAHWEGWLQNDLGGGNASSRRRFYIFELLGSGGIFIGTQIAALGIVLISNPNQFNRWSTELLSPFLFLSGVTITVLTIIAFKKDIWRERT